MLQIDTEFQSLIPPLSPEERQGLEENITQYGCRQPLDVWQNTIIDGHNRFEICERLHLPFRTNALEFPDRNAVKIWIIRNQFDRRNLSAYNRSVLALKMEDVFREQGRDNQKKAGEMFGENHSKQEVLANLPKPLQTVNTRAEVAKIAGVSERTIGNVKKIEARATPDVKAKLATGEMSIHEAHKQIKREQQQEQRKQVAITLEAPTRRVTALTDLQKCYRVIYADPPWQYGNDQTQALPGSTRPDDHYVTMPTEQIAALPVRHIILDNAVLFLWTTTAHLEEAFQVVKAWGFAYKTNIVWDKVKHNYGPYISVRHELLLIATRGACTPEKSGSIPSVQRIERLEHSEKPEEFRVIIQQLYPFGQRLELFARKTSPGWDTWGTLEGV
jgi:N6-adenosine-specific RNA methylase IME4